MTLAARQTIATDLLAELAELINGDVQPDRFTMLRLDRAAESLRKVDPAGGCIAKAGVAVLSWDYAECRHWVANSLHFDSGVDGLFNASVSLEKLNLMEEALVYLERAYEMAPKNTEVVARYLHGLNSVGRLKEAAKIVEECLEQEMQLPRGIPNLIDITRFCEEFDISLERIQFELSAALGVLTNNKKRARYLQHRVFTDHDGESSFIMKVGFVGDLQDELRLEAELAPILAEEPGWDPCLLSTEFHYASKKIENADETV